MCGILGYFGNEVEISIFKKALSTISHRGPDDEAINCFKEADKILLLGHTRLSIIDLSLFAKQPMGNEDESIWLTCNGEIYNYGELRKELISKKHIFKSKTDSEVLLHLYEEKGIEVLQHLNGIFGFGIWDSKKRELFLARDRFGVKPLYYAETKNGFVFASEIKAILCFPKVEKSLNPIAVHNYLTYLWSPPPDTMLKSVKKLSPGHAMIVKDGKIKKIWQYYDIPYDSEMRRVHVKEVVSDIQELFFQAVKRQLISDVPLGAFLSGGLDSSSVVAVMKEVEPYARPRCYSIGFRGYKKVEGNPNDLPYAKKVASYLDVDLSEIEVGPVDIVGHIKDMIYFLDEPQADPAVINVLLICKKAREDGYKVLLSGAGGDDIFSGYRRHLALILEKTWSWMPLFLRKRLSSLAKNGKVKNDYIRRLRKNFMYADLPAEERLIRQFFWMDEGTRRSLYANEFLNELSDYDPALPLKQSLNKIPFDVHPLNKMLYLEAKHFLPDHNLNYTDKMSMAVGVEVRVPFLDIDLVNYVVKLPPNMKQHFLEGKWIFKKSMEAYLPKEVIYRPKSGFGVPLRRWIKGELKDMVKEYLSEERMKRRGIFDPEGVKGLILMNDKGLIDAAYIIFALICIELWCEMFMDNRREI